MTYTRGEGSVEVELARVQGWVENTDPELWGRNGEHGMIRQFRDEQAERRQTRQFFKIAVTIMGLLGGIPSLILILQLLHLLPK